VGCFLIKGKMAKNETAYTKTTKPETAHGGITKVETAHADVSKSETPYVDPFSGNIIYDEPTATYDMILLLYDGVTKMTKHKDAYAKIAKNETSYA